MAVRCVCALEEADDGFPADARVKSGSSLCLRLPPSLKIHYTSANGDLMRTSPVAGPSCEAPGRRLSVSPDRVFGRFRCILARVADWCGLLVDVKVLSHRPLHVALISNAPGRL